MEYSIEIRGCKDTICSCNSCGIKNYTSSRFLAEEPIVDRLYDIQVGMLVNRLCPKCMGLLASDILQTLNRAVN